jgi:asparagine synthase (glutamine-hydrolysing)
MCAIAGIYVQDNSLQDKIEREVNSMLNIMRHRGPDEIGIKTINKTIIANGRLVIVDKKSGQQPISNESGKLWITFNGEIYNFRSIKKSLLSKGHIFKTSSDTEVILHGYEEYGVGILQKLNGMFAFCISDGKNIFLARDRLGEKPLYYRIEGKTFKFASEIKALLLPKEKFSLNEAYLAIETSVNYKPLFTQIKELPAAHYLIYDGDKINLSCYWRISKKLKSFDKYKEKDLIEHLRTLIIKVVKARVPEDQEFGVFASGGLDSAIIASIAKPQYLFTSITQEKKHNEEQFAEILSKSIKSRLIKVYPRINDFLNDITKIVWHLNEPTTTLAAFPLYELSKHASKYVRVILNGNGGDELFGGYTRYLALYLESIIKQCQQLYGYEPLATHFWGKNYAEALPIRYYQLIHRSKYDSNEVSEIINKSFKLFPNQPINAAGYADLQLSFPPLLRTEDRMTMAWGIEARSPFLDHELVEFVFSLPDQMKISKRKKEQFVMKNILREATKSFLPKEIFYRNDKIGFPSPVANWLNKELDSIMRNIISEFRSIKEFLPVQNSLNPLALGEYNRSKWQILQLTIWHMLFIQNLSHRKIHDRYLSLKI